ncbi:hypothetical protein BDW71DRAFT_170715, partial [Aspergillus fruticulosus]
MADNAPHKRRRPATACQYSAGNATCAAFQLNAPSGLYSSIPFRAACGEAISLNLRINIMRGLSRSRPSLDLGMSTPAF